MLSNTCKYAIRAMIYLAIHHKKDVKIGIKQIAKEVDMPAPFLSKILQTLAKNDILESSKGPHGGFSLAKPANEITLKEIIKIIDGNQVFSQCILGLGICKNNESLKEICPVHPRSEPLRDDINKFFTDQTIGEIAKKIGASDIKISF